MSEDLDQKLIESVAFHEGFRANAYQDTEGVWTIGYGTNLQELKITEGLGRVWMKEALAQAQKEAEQFGWFHNLGRARRNVIVEMIYNLGLPRFNTFQRLKGALAARNYEKAAEEMLDSKWAEQVGRRAERLAKTMRTGWYG
jgi:lysozyme